MPIPEAVQAYLADEANKQELLGTLEADLPTYLSAKGHVVKAATDYRKEIDESFKQSAVQIESALGDAAKVLGVERPPNTPIAAWAKIFADEASKKVGAKSTETPPQPPKEGDAALLAQINELKNQYGQLQTSLKEKEELANRKIVESSILGDLSGARLGDTQEVKAAKQQALLSLIKTNHSPKVDANGNTVFYGSDGLPLVHADGRFKTALDIAKEKYSFMLLPEAQKIEGLGLGGNIKMMSDHVIADNLDAINAEAAKKGLVRNSQEWKDFTQKSIAASQAQYQGNFKI